MSKVKSLLANLDTDIKAGMSRDELSKKYLGKDSVLKRVYHRFKEEANIMPPALRKSTARNLNDLKEKIESRIRKVK